MYREYYAGRGAMICAGSRGRGGLAPKQGPGRFQKEGSEGRRGSSIGVWGGPFNKENPGGLGALPQEMFS